MPAPDNSLERASRGTRPVWFGDSWRDVAIWSRRDLPAGAVITAPAILEQPDATIVVEPGLQGRVDKLGNVILERLS
jgi:N-methylhydantoinase A